jgi:hypothetical protein
MTRIYREPGAGMTYVERGAGGGGVIIVPDHGGPGDVIFRFRPVDESDGATLVHDDEQRSVSAEYAADVADRMDQILERIIGAIAAAKIPAAAKAELRGAVDDARGTG